MLIKINGINIWAKTYGSNKNDCIILIAGAMALASFWDENSVNHWPKPIS